MSRNMLVMSTDMGATAKNNTIDHFARIKRLYL